LHKTKNGDPAKLPDLQNSPFYFDVHGFGNLQTDVANRDILTRAGFARLHFYQS